ncbi:MAG: hypothetical protein ABI193_26925 [Minicystis sp.]
MPLARPIADGDAPSSAAAVPPDALPHSAVRARSEHPPAATGASSPQPPAAEGSPPPAAVEEGSAEPPPSPATAAVAEGAEPLPSPGIAAIAEGAAARVGKAEQTPLSPVAPEPAPENTARVAQRPLLASEALMDDLAPVEPSRDAARLWCAALGLCFAIFGTLPLIGVRLGGLGAAVPSLVLGAIAMVAALPGITYRQRAIAMVVLGLLSDIVGLQGTAVGGLGWNLARLVPAIAIGAALMFRARYRAYTGARVFLGAALLSSLPFVVQVGLGLMGGMGAAEIAGLIALVAIAASFTGFMGAETTGAGPYLAHGVALTFAAELVARSLGAPGARLDASAVIQVIIPALAFVGSSVLSALGLFQIVAWRFAADARRIDLHTPPAHVETLHDSRTDWSTRD